MGSLSACDKAADFAAGGFDIGGIGTNGDAFVHRADFELDVGCDLGVDFDADGFTNVFLEARRSGFDVVEPDRKAGNGVYAAFIDRRFAFEARSGVADVYSGTTDGQTGWMDLGRLRRFVARRLAGSPSWPQGDRWQEDGNFYDS